MRAVGSDDIRGGVMDASCASRTIGSAYIRAAFMNVTCVMRAVGRRSGWLGARPSALEIAAIAAATPSSVACRRMASLGAYWLCPALASAANTCHEWGTCG